MKNDSKTFHSFSELSNNTKRDYCELKKPLSFKQQLYKLTSHKLIIDDPNFAISVLEKVNYYRFTGYALSFRKDDNSGDFILGTTFNHIYELYCFDKELRALLFKYIDIVEAYYRTQIAYGFAMNKNTAPPYDQHYCRDNFYNKKGYDKVFESLIKEKDIHNADSLIVKHHNEKYDGKMPIWVIVELLSFSNLSKLYSAMYESEQSSIAGRINVGHVTLKNHLHCLSILRNKCAHGAMLYDKKFNFKGRFNRDFLRKYPEVKKDSLFAYILILQKRLPSDKNKLDLSNELCSLVKQYEKFLHLNKIGFPENYKTILFFSDKNANL